MFDTLLRTTGLRGRFLASVAGTCFIGACVLADRGWHVHLPAGTMCLCSRCGVRGAWRSRRQHAAGALAPAQRPAQHAPHAAA